MGGAHLQLPVHGAQVLSFLLQALDPHLPLLPAARGRRPVTLQELAPLLVGVLARGSAPPAARARGVWSGRCWGSLRGKNE